MSLRASLINFKYSPFILSIIMVFGAINVKIKEKKDQIAHKKRVTLDKTLGNLNEEQMAFLIELAEKADALANELLEKLYTLPNLPAAIVPEGKTPEENVNVFQEGAIPVLHEGAQPHWELVKKYDIIDFELGNKITGAGFPV